MQSMHMQTSVYFHSMKHIISSSWRYLSKNVLWCNVCVPVSGMRKMLRPVNRCIKPIHVGLDNPLLDWWFWQEGSTEYIPYIHPIFMIWSADVRFSALVTGQTACDCVLNIREQIEHVKCASIHFDIRVCYDNIKSKVVV